MTIKKQVLASYGVQTTVFWDLCQEQAKQVFVIFFGVWCAYSGTGMALALLSTYFPEIDRNIIIAPSIPALYNSWLSEIRKFYPNLINFVQIFTSDVPVEDRKKWITKVLRMCALVVGPDFCVTVLYRFQRFNLVAPSQHVTKVGKAFGRLSQGCGWYHSIQNSICGRGSQTKGFANTICPWC